MLCFPNAKINLGLHVVAKRTDGYHDIETCFYPIPLHDALEIVPASDFSFSQTGIQLDTAPENNLVIKAMNLFKRTYEISPSAIFLKKVIPVGAGLGGGSADAAFMLKLLREFISSALRPAGQKLEAVDHPAIDPRATDTELEIMGHNSAKISFVPRATDAELETMAAELGADCPFFIKNTPVIATGIGNIFHPVALSLQGYTLCIIKPNVYVSTRDAYAMVKPSKPSYSLHDILQKPVNEWKDCLTNDFEAGIFQQFPVIAECKKYLYTCGASYAAMSGSGSAVFGLFDQDVNISFPDCFIWKGIL